MITLTCCNPGRKSSSQGTNRLGIRPNNVELLVDDGIPTKNDESAAVSVCSTKLLIKNTNTSITIEETIIGCGAATRQITVSKQAKGRGIYEAKEQPHDHIMSNQSIKDTSLFKIVSQKQHRRPCFYYSIVIIMNIW